MSVSLSIKVVRHKGGTWSVFMTLPDGSTEGHRGLVDEHDASYTIERAILKIERQTGA